MGSMKTMSCAVAVLLAALCFAGVLSAPANNGNALEPIVGDSDEANPAELMMDLMKTMMQMQEGGDSEGMDKISKVMEQATDLMKDMQSGDMSPDQMQMKLMGAALQMAGTAGMGDILDPSALGKMFSGNVEEGAMMLIRKVMGSVVGVEESDPLLKLAISGAKMAFNGQAAPDDNPFTHLHDVLHPNIPNHDNAMMSLMLDTIKAASEATSGDPLNAMVEYVLDHPKAASNPIVSN